MRKVCMFFIVAVFAFSITAVTAWGSELDIAQAGKLEIDEDGDPSGPPGGAVTVAEELLTEEIAVDLEEGDSDYERFKPRDILYSPNIDIKSTSTIEIEVVNGSFHAVPGNKMYMLLKDEKGDAALAATMTDIIAWSGDHYKQMRFQFTKVDRDASGDTDGEGEDKINSGEVLSFSTIEDESREGGTYPSNGEYDDHSPTIIINKGLAAGSTVTIKVYYAKDDNGSEANAPRTNEETIARVVEGLATGITKIKSTIDAQKSRKKFVDECDEKDVWDPLSDPCDTDENSSMARNLHVDQEKAEIGFYLQEADSYTITLTRTDCTGVQDVYWSSSQKFVKASTCSWTRTGHFNDNMGEAMLKGTQDIEIRVNETEYLETGKWKLSLVINTSESNGSRVLTELENVESHEWDINGMQVKIPYMVLNSLGYLSFIKVANEAPTDAELQADAIIWDVTQYPDSPNKPGPLPKDTVVVIKIIPKESVTTVTESELMEAFGLYEDHLYHVEMTLTVVAPLNSVHVAAFQKSPDGRTDIPVLYNVYSQDGRQWQ